MHGPARLGGRQRDSAAWPAISPCSHRRGKLEDGAANRSAAASASPPPGRSHPRTTTQGKTFERGVRQAGRRENTSLPPAWPPSPYCHTRETFGRDGRQARRRENRSLPPGWPNPRTPTHKGKEVDYSSVRLLGGARRAPAVGSTNLPLIYIVKALRHGAGSPKIATCQTAV